MDQEPDASGGGEAPPATQPTPAISDPLLSATATAAAPSPLDDLCYEVDSLQDLAARGQWRSVLDKVARARSLSLLSRPHDHLVYLTFSALALLKLRRPADALTELDSLQPLPTSPDPFASPRFLFESYPNLYPGRQGSMLPFSLRLLHASIPQNLGDRPETLDRLYSLLDFVRSKIGGHHGSSEEKDSSFAADRWRRREALLMSSLICNHFCHREFDVALSLIRDLLLRSPSDPVLLSRLAYIQLQIGDLDGAKATFAKVEGLRSEEMGVEFENLVGRNRALEFLVAKDFASAAREYDECIERDPGDVVAVNNKAMCLMYSRDLSDAIKLLEGALERVPTAAVNETVVVNLCSMYELAYVNHGEIKKSLSNWIARVAPDDFDPSCTRI
ncbi:trafficking protein particle complex subunit 12 [Cocos nucifera]|uniref:Trafficking protein particle complex subunit 12 n=1 Tax=Cocos nucifera TaxID=13894 RepID=A0A8K0IX36_COCNU|nr:trafficking protein particle complex subunit 12 [Cocos nucifera]